VLMGLPDDRFIERGGMGRFGCGLGDPAKGENSGGAHG